MPRWDLRFHYVCNLTSKDRARSVSKCVFCRACESRHVVCVRVAPALNLSPFALHISGVIYALIVFCTASLQPAAESPAQEKILPLKQSENQKTELTIDNL